MKRHDEFNFKLPALRIFENEHHFLRFLMGEWHPIVLNFERGVYSLEEAHEAIQILKLKMIDFIEPFKNHTDKEEKYMFKMLIKYVGDEQGPVKAVQDEHEEIDAYIGHFLHHLRGDISGLSLADMLAIVRDAGEAFEVITFHMIKEETIVFPMVQDILTKNEKYELFENVYTPII